MHPRFSFFLLCLVLAGCDLKGRDLNDTTISATTTSAKTFSVEGTIRFAGTGPLHLYIADAETFETPMAGIDHVILAPTERALKTKRITYRFEGVPKGTYALRCFQDENGNGKLDRGMTGPKEPWGMSFRPGKTKKMRPPKFPEVSFDVHAHVEKLDLVVD